MSDQQLSSSNPCPVCGEQREVLESPCNSCGWKPPPTRSPALERVRVTTAMLMQAARTVSIGSMLLITGLVAVCLAVSIWSPVYGLPLCFVSAIALARTGLYATYCKAAGEPLGITAKLLAFVQAVLLSTAITAAASVAFTVTCFPTGMATHNLIVAVVVGGISAAVVAIGLLFCVPVYRQGK